MQKNHKVFKYQLSDSDTSRLLAQWRERRLGRQRVLLRPCISMELNAKTASPAQPVFTTQPFQKIFTNLKCKLQVSKTAMKKEKQIQQKEVIAEIN